MAFHEAFASVIALLLYSSAICKLSYAQNPIFDAIQWKSSVQRLDECFCELRGQVDDCCCDVETVDSLNRDRIYPLITSLTKQSFFRFFPVDLNHPCPFWPDDGHCVLKDCHVEKCTEDEIPSFLKGSEEEEEAPVITDRITESCSEVSEEERRLSVIDSTISQEQRQEFMAWQEYDDSEDNFCELQAGNPQDLSYVDLQLNPERYTGYSGHSTQRIWGAIYHENCFRPEEGHPSAPLFDSSQVQGMCLEKRAFYRLISGMHASINIHLSALYIASGRETSNPKFHPNLNEFVRRFDAATTNGQGPSWLKNLYFAYLLVLRAVEKAGPYWGGHAFFTGDAFEDLQVQNTVGEIVKAAKSCSSLFDETMLFNGNTSQLLKNEFKAHFKNISRIMDCVGCSKCRLWGKLQIQGIGTALKILFSGRKNGWSLRLTRREIIALFNAIGRFSNSIHSLEMFREMQTSKDDSGRDSRGDSSRTPRTRSEL